MASEVGRSPASWIAFVADVILLDRWPLSPLTDLNRASMPEDSESDNPASDMVHYTSRKTGQFAAQALKHSTVLQNNCAILASMNDQLYFLVGVSRSSSYFVGIHKNELMQTYSNFLT